MLTILILGAIYHYIRSNEKFIIRIENDLYEHMY